MTAQKNDTLKQYDGRLTSVLRSSKGREKHGKEGKRAHDALGWSAKRDKAGAFVSPPPRRKTFASEKWMVK